MNKMIHFDKERKEIVDDTGKNVTDEAFIAVCDMAHKIQSEENFEVAIGIFAKFGVQIFFTTDYSAGYMASPMKK